MNLNLQIFFFSINTLVLGGLYLSSDFFEKHSESFTAYSKLLKSSYAKIIISLIALICGLFSLFDYSGPKIIFLSDLLPGILLLVVGFIILIKFLEDKFSLNNMVTSFVNKTSKLHSLIGFIAIAIAIIHLLIPQALLF